ncbi:MAG: chemotaxis protein CheA, partial [Candidatus Electrothrix sp. ATG1]|nr:chemotaxis protein CheA [Candidatus Electrothrix sp. ATG1]
MLPDFIVEAAEHLEEMESSLLRLEQDYNDKEVMDEIFRSIHTIKGAAQFVGIERVSELSHKMENLLDLIRKDDIALN